MPFQVDRRVVSKFCKKLRITLVFSPTEGSFLNPIETHFGVLGRATYASSDDPTHLARRRRVYRSTCACAIASVATRPTRSREFVRSSQSTWNGTSPAERRN